MAVEKMQGISRLEQFVEELSEEERAKELKLEKKRQKRKNRRKNKCGFDISEQEAENKEKILDEGPKTEGCLSEGNTTGYNLTSANTCRTKELFSSLCGDKFANIALRLPWTVHQNNLSLHMGPTKANLKATSDEESGLTQDEIQAFLEQNRSFYSNRHKYRQVLKEKFTNYCRGTDQTKQVCGKWFATTSVKGSREDGTPTALAYRGPDEREDKISSNQTSIMSDDLWRRRALLQVNYRDSAVSGCSRVEPDLVPDQQPPSSLALDTENESSSR
ncbi:hypothetical protein GOODEAATRI_016838 [Goodea atripinnis]|uniref:Gametogenetin-binding protein 2 n=1 Tax=Goodea atripinnis TaxID=208336 RepID=A0ABV0NMG3_9TELE